MCVCEEEGDGSCIGGAGVVMRVLCRSTLTHLLLHTYSYTPTLTRLLLHDCSCCDAGVVQVSVGALSGGVWVCSCQHRPPCRRPQAFHTCILIHPFILLIAEYYNKIETPGLLGGGMYQIREPMETRRKMYGDKT